MEKVSGQSVTDLRDYGRALWRHRGLIVATAVIAVVVAFVISASQTRVYEATTQLAVQRLGALDSLQPTTQDPARNVDSETDLLRGNAVRNQARASLGHDFDVNISSTTTSDVVNVTARGSDATRAAGDANGYAAAYIAVRRKQDIADVSSASRQIEAKIAAITKGIVGLPSTAPEVDAAQQRLTPLQQQLDQLQLSTDLSRPGQAQVVASAVAPGSPVTPKPLRNAGIALALGLLLGVCLTFVREYFDDSVVSLVDLRRATGDLPVLGEVPRVREWRDRSLPYVAALDSPQSPAAESYRTLRTSMQFIAVDREFDTVQVTSAQPEDGKTTTIVNLAVVFARAGRKVVVVCCDLRRPRTHEFFDLTNTVGLTSLFLDEAKLSEAIQPVHGEPNLAIIAAGPTPPNPSELLSSARAHDLIAYIAKTHDLVLIDSPPVLPVGDALIVSGMVDATLLVASANSSSRRAVQRSVEMLRQVHAPLIGTVLNNAESIEGYGTYGHRYFDKSSKADKSTR